MVSISTDTNQHNCFFKREVSYRQRSLGIPHIEVESTSTEDIVWYLRFSVNGDFWNWVDNLPAPGSYGPLQVSFKQWLESSSHIKNKSSLSSVFNEQLHSHLNLRV